MKHRRNWPKPVSAVASVWIGWVVCVRCERAFVVDCRPVYRWRFSDVTARSECYNASYVLVRKQRDLKNTYHRDLRVETRARQTIASVETIENMLIAEWANILYIFWECCSSISVHECVCADALARPHQCLLEMFAVSTCIPKNASVLIRSRSVSALRVCECWRLRLVDVTVLCMCETSFDVFVWTETCFQQKMFFFCYFVFGFSCAPFQRDFSASARIEM